MAIKLPTNFDLSSEAFMDNRQGIAKSLTDLRNWNFDENPIPEGFEVFVEGDWYTYMGKSSDFDSLTGYFKVRGGINVVQDTGYSTVNVMSQAAVTENLTALSDRIQEIVGSLGIILELKQDKTFQSYIGRDGGLYEKGVTISPGFAWRVYYNGKEVDPSSVKNINVYKIVDGQSYDAGGTVTPGSIDEEGNIIPISWQLGPKLTISENTTYMVKVQYGVGVSQLTGYLTIDYKFINKKYWGLVYNPGDTTNNVIDQMINPDLSGILLGEELSEDRKLELTTFDCSVGTNGLYPVYAIPSDVYNIISNPIRVLVGNIEVSTYTLKNITINSGTDDYVIVSFSIPQKGQLNIEFI